MKPVSLSKERFCGSCRELHHITEFRQWRPKGRVGAPDFRCKKAKTDYDLARYSNQAPKLRAQNKAWRARNPEREMVLQARARARKAGVPCTITWRDIEIPEFCPVLGIRLQIAACGTGGGCPDSPSLDRIDPALGYVPGNVWVISGRANLMKNDASRDELLAFAYKMLEVFGG